MLGAAELGKVFDVGRILVSFVSWDFSVTPDECLDIRVKVVLARDVGSGDESKGTIKVRRWIR